MLVAKLRHISVSSAKQQFPGVKCRWLLIKFWCFIFRRKQVPARLYRMHSTPSTQIELTRNTTEEQPWLLFNHRTCGRLNQPRPKGPWSLAGIVALLYLVLPYVNS